MTRPPSAWFCAAHHLWTTGDCPRCDDELIALTEDPRSPTGDRCSCGNEFDGDNFCMVSACQDEE